MHYKVVYKTDDGLLVSVMAKQYPASAVITYTPGEWAEPRIPNSPIFVFCTLSTAKDFLLNDDRCEIWACQVQDVRPPILGMLLYRADISKRRRLAAFWEDPDAFMGRASIGDCPPGTVWASRIKLVERVWPKGD